ncbi:hypothetical protein [Lactococcus taiwanensis]|uniref:hypothetical protein n=1 Tax=Lactococcus taiwanensis TaxID=1151742 RepID=UPI00196231F0|nr:hypothetical protein [Lactococcus taiwanensis]QRZ12100.1 hypothetical protein JVB21_03630 [Lactococcus taiwanensis]
MTETTKAVIDRLQGEAGYATGGYVDRLVFSGLDVHEMLNEIEQAIDTDEELVEKLQEQLNTAKKALTELESISVYPVDRYDESCGYDWESAIEKAEKTAQQALTALEGGEDEL